MDLSELQLDRESARLFIPLKPDWCHGDQTLDDAATLIALARMKENGRFLEIGTSAGEGAAALLYGARDGTATLTGVDLAKQVYYDKSRKVGDVVAEAVPHLAGRYTVITGAMSDRVLGMEGSFDLIHIDAAHSHPWAVFDMLCALTKAEPGAIVAFHDANYTAALSQAAYFFSRVFAGHGRFIGNHFAFEYRGPTPELVEAILRSLDLTWQAALPPKLLVALHGPLHDVFSEADAMRIMARLLERDGHYMSNVQIYTDINKGLWHRELERRKLLAAQKG